MRSTLSTFTKHTMGRLRRRTSTKQRSITWRELAIPAGLIEMAADSDPQGLIVEAVSMAPLLCGGSSCRKGRRERKSFWKSSMNRRFCKYLKRNGRGERI